MPKVQTDDGILLNYRMDDFRDPWATHKREAILMHHGFARSLKWWTQWVPSLSRRYAVVRYDCRGCGESSVPAEGAEWSADRLAKDALNLIDSLGIDQVHWVGFESGGVFGVLFAGTYPSRVKSLTLINTPSAHTSGWQDVATVSKYGKISEAIQTLGFPQWVERTISARLDLTWATPELVRWHVDEHSRTPTHVATSIMGVMDDLGDLTADLPARVEAPVLMMHGETSLMCPREQQLALFHSFSNAKRFIAFPNIGHGIHLLIPDRCAHELLDFLDGV